MHAKISIGLLLFFCILVSGQNTNHNKTQIFGLTMNATNSEFYPIEGLVYNCSGIDCINTICEVYSTDGVDSVGIKPQIDCNFTSTNDVVCTCVGFPKFDLLENLSEWNITYAEIFGLQKISELGYQYVPKSLILCFDNDKCIFDVCGLFSENILIDMVSVVPVSYGE